MNTSAQVFIPGPILLLFFFIIIFVVGVLPLAYACDCADGDAPLTKQCSLHPILSPLYRCLSCLQRCHCKRSPKLTPMRIATLTPMAGASTRASTARHSCCPQHCGCRHGLLCWAVILLGFASAS